MILRKMLTALWLTLLVIYLLGFTVFWGGYIAGTPFA
jgi:succinate dehydrogenase hydrophobic anchor subunit